jgi:hypothetical protein
MGMAQMLSDFQETVAVVETPDESNKAFGDALAAPVA